MDHKYWNDRWDTGHIGFHESKPNPALVDYFHQLRLNTNDRVLVPLCGKTLDIGWLLTQQCKVVGVELSERAVSELWSELDISPQVSRLGPLKHFQSSRLEVFQGDIFALSRAHLGPIDAIYDRAALVALPPDMRRRYAKHIMEISGGAPQLLLCYTYDQGLFPGPPFSVSHAEVTSLYSDNYALSLLETKELEGGLKGEHPATENIWLLQPRPPAN